MALAAAPHCTPSLVGWAGALLGSSALTASPTLPWGDQPVNSTEQDGGRGFSPRATGGQG